MRMMVATSELRYGDNDRLAARLAVMIEADCLLILSDVDGLYDANPREHANANHISTITRITRKSKHTQKVRPVRYRKAVWSPN